MLRCLSGIQTLPGVDLEVRFYAHVDITSSDFQPAMVFNESFIHFHTLIHLTYLAKIETQAFEGSLEGLS